MTQSISHSDHVMSRDVFEQRNTTGSRKFFSPLARILDFSSVVLSVNGKAKALLSYKNNCFYMTPSTFLIDSNFKFVKPLSRSSNQLKTNTKQQHSTSFSYFVVYLFTLVFLKIPKYHIIQKGYSKFITVTAIEKHSKPHKQRMVSLWYYKNTFGPSLQDT